MEKVDEREKLQRLMAQIGGYREMVEALHRQIDGLTKTLLEISATRESLGSLKGLKEAEIMVPIGSDSFIKAKLPKLDRVVIGIGAELAAERTPEEAEEALKARSGEVEKAIEQTRGELEKMEERIRTLSPEAERLIQKLEKERAG